MGSTGAILLFFVIAIVMSLFNTGYNKDKDDYLSGEDGNDHYEG